MKNSAKYETHACVIGDNTSVRHRASLTIVRSSSQVTEFTVRTACCPTGASQRLTSGEWTSRNLPSIILGPPYAQFCVTTYRMREEPNCIQCLVIPMVF